MVLYAERLDNALPGHHVVRLLDEILGGGTGCSVEQPSDPPSAVPSGVDWSRWEAAYHGRLGQPAIHPWVLASVLLYGWLTRIRSSRGLEEALQVRMDFRWLAEGRTIDHTTLSEFRRNHAAELQDMIVQIVQIAQGMGVAALTRLGFDGTRVRGNATRQERVRVRRRARLLLVSAALPAGEGKSSASPSRAARSASRTPRAQNGHARGKGHVCVASASDPMI